MNRRAFLGSLTGGLLAAPLAVEGQDTRKVLRIGLLSGGVPRSTSSYQAFEAKLRDLGYIDGDTMRFEFRNAQGKGELLPVLAAELVRAGVDLIITAFVVVVLGGLGSVAGAMVGGLIIGVTQTLTGFYVSVELKDVMALVLFILILLIRPQGLFGRAGMEEVGTK